MEETEGEIGIKNLEIRFSSFDIRDAYDVTVLENQVPEVPIIDDEDVMH